MLLTNRAQLFLIQIILILFFFSGCNSNKKKQEAEQGKTEQIHTETKIVKSDSAKLIIPGKSIGLTKLYENADSVFQTLGKPDSSDAAMGKMLAAWNKNGIHWHIFFGRNMGSEDETSRVRQIRINSSLFVTGNGISVGSNVDEIKKKFPDVKAVGSYISPQTHLQTTVYDDLKNGIALETDAKNGCVGISVHKSNQQAYEIYNALFPDFEIKN